MIIVGGLLVGFGTQFARDKPQTDLAKSAL
jgi:hypothetical protein